MNYCISLSPRKIPKNFQALQEKKTDFCFSIEQEKSPCRTAEIRPSHFVTPFAAYVRTALYSALQRIIYFYMLQGTI